MCVSYVCVRGRRFKKFKLPQINHSVPEGFEDKLVKCTYDFASEDSCVLAGHGSSRHSLELLFCHRFWHRSCFRAQ